MTSKEEENLTRFKREPNVRMLAILCSISYLCLNNKKEDLEKSKVEVKNKLDIAKDLFMKCGMADVKLVDMDKDTVVVRKDDELFAVFRGTEWNCRDLFNDAKIALFDEATETRMNTAYNFIEVQLKNEGLNWKDVTTSGHSLGGNIAQYIAKKKQCKCVSFNAAFPITKVIRQRIKSFFGGVLSIFGHKSPKKKKYENIIGFHINGDFISCGEHLGERIDLDGPKICNQGLIGVMDPHKLSNFTQLVINYQENKDKIAPKDWLQKKSEGNQPKDIGEGANMKPTIEGIEAVWEALPDKNCSFCGHKFTCVNYGFEGNVYFHIECLVNAEYVIKKIKESRELASGIPKQEESENKAGTENNNEETKDKKNMAMYFCL